MGGDRHDPPASSWRGHGADHPRPSPYWSEDVTVTLDADFYDVGEGVWGKTDRSASLPTLDRADALGRYDDSYAWAIPGGGWRAASADVSPRRGVSVALTPGTSAIDTGGGPVDTWLIVLIVVVVLVVLALAGLALAKRSRVSRVRREAEHREQARENIQEAHVRAARADAEQALAEEQAAHARRELAEVQQRAAQTEKEARERAAGAEEDRSAAERLRAEAQRLAPDVDPDGQRGHPEGGATRR